MAVKVLNTTVIDNNRNITSAVGTLTMTDDYGPDVHVTATNVSGSSPPLDIESNSQIFLNLTGNGVVTLANSQRGCLSEIIMTTNGNTPTFDGTDFYWSGDITPPWGDHDIWRISCVGLSSAGTCAASAVGYDESGTLIPTSGTGVTATGRESSVGDLAYSSFEDQIDQNAYARAEVGFRFTRASNEFRIEIFDDGSSGSGSADWFDTSNATTPLTQAGATIYTNTSAIPSAVRMVWSVTPVTTDPNTTGSVVSSYTEGDWLATPSNGDGITIEFTATANVQTGFASRRDVYVIEFWGRSNGFDDTILVTYEIDIGATAEII